MGKRYNYVTSQISEDQLLGNLWDDKIRHTVSTCNPAAVSLWIPRLLIPQKFNLKKEKQTKPFQK